MPPLTLAEADRLRAERGRSALLYLTDDCPVGCAHCSVAATPGSGRADLTLLGRLVDGLCALPGLRLVGISGGEPFTARRALADATARLAAAGKQTMLYTSGTWGRDDGSVPDWTRAVLARTACVVLGTDRYHAARIPVERCAAALRPPTRKGAGSPCR